MNLTEVRQAFEIAQEAAEIESQKWVDRISRALRTSPGDQIQVTYSFGRVRESEALEDGGNELFTVRINGESTKGFSLEDAVRSAFEKLDDLAE